MWSFLPRESLYWSDVLNGRCTEVPFTVYACETSPNQNKNQTINLLTIWHIDLVMSHAYMVKGHP